MNLVMLTIVALYMISSHAQLALCLSVLFFSTWYAVHLEKKKKSGNIM